MIYSIGDTPKVFATFTGPSGAVDPGVVSLKIKDPAGTVTTITYPIGIARDAIGSYSYRLPVLTLSGEYLFKWFGSSIGSGAGSALESAFQCAPTSFP